MELLGAPAWYDTHERVRVSAGIRSVLVGIVLGVGRRALIGVARGVARLGPISACVMNRGHAVNRTDVEQRRFLAAGIVGKGLHTLRRAFPNLPGRCLRLHRGLHRLAARD